MISIHIARNRQPLGQFSPEQVAEGLASGKFLATDLGWREPMEAWKPLSEFTDLPPWSSSSAPPSLEVEVIEPPALPQPAWERRTQLGFFPAMAQTVRQVLSVPVATFKEMERKGGLGAPLSFYLVVSTFTAWMAMAYQLVAVLMNPERMLGPLAKSLTTGTLLAIQIGSMALVPIVMAGVAFCAAGIFHLVFQLLGNEREPFEVTFRAYCYSVAPASMFRLVPICGDFLFFVAALVLLIFAVREALRLDGIRATVGVILPSLLCCGFFWAGAMLAAGTLAQGAFK